MSQILNLLGFIDGAFFVSGSRLSASGIFFNENSHHLLLQQNSAEMAGNPSTLFFRLPQTTPGKRYPPLQRSSGKLSPSESASFRIFSTSLLLQMDLKLSATKNNRENQKQKRPQNKPAIILLEKILQPLHLAGFYLLPPSP